MTTASTSNTNFAFASSSSSGGTTVNINPWGHSEFVEFIEYSARIEVFYKQHRMINSWPPPTDQERVYKIIFSCKDGVWHKSNPIYGKIIPAQSEYFEFEDNEQ